MSILETIRQRASILIVVLIGGALLVFILEDAFNSGKFFFSGNENVVASGAGQKIEFKDINNKIEEVTYYQQNARQTHTLDDETTKQIQQSVFAEMVSDMIMGPQRAKLGLNITDDELTDLMLGEHLAPEVIRNFLTDPKTGKVYDQLVDPKTGGINRAMWVNFVKNMDNDKNQQQVACMDALYHLTEEEVKENSLQQKYMALVKNSLFVTDAEAKQDMLNENTYYNIRYVLKKYSSIQDNSVTVTDQDISNYYNQHLYEYKQPEESRKIDYVSFLASPTDKDMAELNRDADSIASLMRTSKEADDSSLIVASSDDHYLDPNYHKEGTLSPTIDSVMKHAEKGFVYGPYTDMNKIKVAKLLDIAELPDSSKVSHILIAVSENATDADVAAAKKRADSIKDVATKENFADLAKQFSQDPGTKDKGGEMGWFAQDAQLVPEFLHASFFNDKGSIVIARSQYGFHIIYIEDQTKKYKSLHVGIVSKNIVPSRGTIDGVFGEASSFAGKASTTDLFEQTADKMNKRLADVKENDPSVPGMTNSKELIRWAYTAKTGDVSQVFDVGGFKYVVAHLVQVSPKGTSPLEIVKEQVRQKALEEKKAEKIMDDMKSALQGANNIAAFSQKMNVQPETQQRLSFTMYSIPGLGKEDELLGTMTAIKPNTLSQPIKGTQGVYVIQVDSVYTNGAGDFRVAQQQQQQSLQNRAQYDVYDALQKKTNFVNHLGRFF